MYIILAFKVTLKFCFTGYRHECQDDAEVFHGVHDLLCRALRISESKEANLPKNI